MHRQQRELMMENFQAMYDAAHAAGDKAAIEKIPTPMQVQGFMPESEGLCGFAWVNVKPGTSRFAKWLKEKSLARKDDYYGGVTIWVGAYGQSVARKEAYAYAFASEMTKQLANAKITNVTVYGASRLD